MKSNNKEPHQLHQVYARIPAEAKVSLEALADRYPVKIKHRPRKADSRPATTAELVRIAILDLISYHEKIDALESSKDPMSHRWLVVEFVKPHWINKSPRRTP